MSLEKQALEEISLITGTGGTSSEKRSAQKKHISLENLPIQAASALSISYI